LAVHVYKFLIVLALAMAPALSWAHSVGQVQTTKFFAPETVQMLTARASGGTPGFQTGDTINYIIQFAPIRNGANTGVAGYITDYVSPGMEVVGASIVNKDSAGNYVPIAPSLPGGIDFGWGNRGQRTFLAPFNTAAYDPTGRCLAGGFIVGNCNGRLTELHADTGIFFSTDSRTAQFPAQPARIAQGTNGYEISPTAEGQLNPIIGQPNATTHNLWDASMTNAFGSTQGAIDATPAPKSAQTALSNGTGPSPFFAASAVAGPQTGYQFDYTGAVGPWQRIAYTGSRIGDPSIGPATAADVSTTAVGGVPTSAGVALSAASPLPAGTNAVRWAVGKLIVGEIRYVKISLRVTGAIPVAGITNASEVWGGDAGDGDNGAIPVAGISPPDLRRVGDAGDGDNGQDNPWRYHVPSVADNNSNLYLYKEVVCVFNGAVCQASTGANITAGSRVRYRITYLNSGNSPQTNVVLSDVLPCLTPANASTVTAIVSGPIGFPSPNPPVTAAGNCGTGARGTVTFPLVATLAAGAGGAIEIDVRNNAGVDDTVINTARLTSTALPAGVTANAVSTVKNSPFINVSKVTTTPLVAAGGTVSYAIRVANDGTANATAFSVYDVLPSMGGALNANTRFSYSSTLSITPNPANPPGSNLPAPTITTAIPPTLTPYSTAAGAANTQEVRWNFGAASILVPGASFTLTFTANVGSSVSASTTPYQNSAITTYTGGVGRTDASNVAPVTVANAANLSITKTNGTTTLVAGSTTTYTITVANGGPSAANGATVRDPAVEGLNCTTLTCTTTGGASCPAPLDVSTWQGSGLAIPLLPANSTVNFLLTCGVTATGQ
jgi:uncharacterized repeat protein (TIGR01451 family)